MAGAFNSQQAAEFLASIIPNADEEPKSGLEIVKAMAPTGASRQWVRGMLEALCANGDVHVFWLGRIKMGEGDGRAFYYRWCD